MKSLVLLALSTAACQAAITLTHSTPVNLEIPDYNPVGLSSTVRVTTPMSVVANVRVHLSITGGWSGDLYAYLSHGGAMAILLNRPGKSVLEPAGSGASGLSLEFADDAPADVHLALPASGIAFGTFQPDARLVDPDDVLDTSPRSAFLSSFHGLDPNGDWTLFLADLSTGDTAKVQSWSLTVTAIPEPATLSLALCGLALVGRRRRPR